MVSKLNRSSWITVAILIVLMALVFLYYLAVRENNKREALESSSVAQVLTPTGAIYTDISGNPVSLSDYIGKTVVAFAWASWCPSCVEQLQLLARVAEENENVVVLAFNRAEPISTAQSFLDFYDLDQTVQLVIDPADYFFTTVEGYAMPETVIFDREGSVYHHERGPLDYDEAEFLIKAAEEKYLQ